MKKMFVILFALAIGLSLIGCTTIGDIASSSEPTIVEGKWKNPDSSSGATYTFSGNRWTFTRTNGQYESGTFEIENDYIVKLTFRNNKYATFWYRFSKTRDDVLFIENIQFYLEDFKTRDEGSRVYMTYGNFIKQ